MTTPTTLLDRILDFDNLHTAWQHVRTNGQTPGVDDWSAKRFARNWEENLRTLADEVRANRYQPKRLRVRHIPKKSGGLRRLGIMTLRDRILQRAALQELEWRFERKFLACSYGYRPNRSLFHAVAAMLRYRDRGFRWILDADIDSCFDSLDHTVLWPLIEQEVWEPPVLHLLEQWLQVGAVTRSSPRPPSTLHPPPSDDGQLGAVTGRASPPRPSTLHPPPSPIGVSQGMPISPLLCNVYLHELDCKVLQRARRPMVRYADDFIVLAHTQEEAERSQELVAGYLEQIKLQLEPAKTRVTSFDDGFEFLGVRFDADSYHYTWQDKQIEVTGGPGPLWSMWDYFPHGYDG